MLDFIHEYTQKNKKKINPGLFKRDFDKPLHEFIIDSCKNLGVIPQLELDSWEYITDQSKINLMINKKLSKDKKIKNNKYIEKLVPLNNSLTNLLRLKFKKTINGRNEYITREILIFKQLDGGFYYIGGKKVLPINQVVDNSTFVKNNILKFKTTLFPIDLYTINKKIVFTDETSMKTNCFRINLFGKTTNPLLYFLARYGLNETIERFELNGIISVTCSELNKECFYYYKINDKLFLEVNKKAIESHEFILQFFASLHELLIAEKVPLKTLYDTGYWLERLSDIFSKRSIKKGKRVLISFSKIMDPTTTKRLSLPDFHKKNTHTIIRWMMTNYSEILRKDNHDLKHKRIRTNECLAYYFDAYITKNINSLLNSDNITSERIDKLLNSINHFTLFKAIRGENPYSLFRYEKYNDFDVINLSRYTLKGPSGLNGGKYGTSLVYRDIYPSHIGRFDLNVCSATDPGLSGYLTANVKIYNDGYFSKNEEPDAYDYTIHKLIDKNTDKSYVKLRYDYMMRELSRNTDGFIKLKKRLTRDEVNHEVYQNPRDHGLYQTYAGLKLIPRYDKNKKGLISLSRVNSIAEKQMKYDRDDRGLILLKRKRRIAGN